MQPDFDPKELAFYCLRVLEIPTPRWTAYDAKFYGFDGPTGGDTDGDAGEGVFVADLVFTLSLSKGTHPRNRRFSIFDLPARQRLRLQARRAGDC